MENDEQIESAVERPKWRLVVRDIVQNPLAEKVVISKSGVHFQSVSCKKKKVGKFSTDNTTVNESDLEEVTSYQSGDERKQEDSIPLVQHRKIQRSTYYLVLNTIPTQNKKNLPKIASCTDFIRGGKTFFGKVVPALFTVGLGHDLVAYFAFPETRFGTTLTQILLGTATNEATWTSDLSNTVVGLPGFYLPLTALLTAPLAMALYNWLRYRNQTVLLDPINNTQQITHLTQALKVDSGFCTDLFRGLFDYRFRKILHQAAFAILWDRRLSPEQVTNDKKAGLLDVLINLASDHGNWTRYAAMEKLRQITDSFHPSNLKMLPENQREQYQTFYQKAHETLKDLSHKKAPITYLYANWLRWTIAERPAFLLDLLFPVWTAYLLASQIRFWALIAFKIKEIVEFIIAQKACNQWHGQWLYREEFGKFVCTVCGEWPFVSAQAMNASQGCLDALLQSVQNATEVLQHLPQVLKHPDFKAVNVYLQNSENWDEEALGELLGNLSFVKKELQLLNISQSRPEVHFLKAPFVPALQQFLQLVRVNTIDLSEQNMGPTIFKQLLPGFVQSRVRDLIISGNNIGDAGLMALSEIFNQTTIRQLIGNKNQLTDESVIAFFKQLPKNNQTAPGLSGEKCIYIYEDGLHIERISATTPSQTQLPRNHTFFVSVEENFMTATGLETVAALLPERTVEVFYAGGNDFSQANMTFVGKQIAKSSVKVLGLGNTGLDDPQIEDFSNTALTEDSSLVALDFSKNPFGDEGAQHFIKAARKTRQLKVVNFSGTGITDTGMKGIACYLSQTAIEKLGLSHCQFTAASLPAFIQSLKKSNGSQLTSLDLSENDIGDEAAELLAQNMGLSLAEINLSATEMTDTGGTSLVLAMQVSDFKRLQVNNNQLTDTSFVQFAENLPQTGLVMLSFNQNQLGLPSVKKLASVLSNSTLESVSFKDNQMPDEGGVLIAEQLLAPTPQGNTIDGTISRDEAHALREAKPKTQLKHIDLSNNQLGKNSKRAFDNVLPGNHITYINNNGSTFFRSAPRLGAMQSNNDNTGMGAGVALASVSGVLLVIIAIYLIYRLGQGTLNYLYPSSSHSSKRDPEDPSCTNQKSLN